MFFPKKNYKKISEGHITMQEFFTNSFLNVSSMLFFCSVFGYLGRILGARIISTLNHGVLIVILAYCILAIYLNKKVTDFVRQENMNYLKITSYINVSLLGFIFGMITFFYHSTVLSTGFCIASGIFIVTSLYGYFTNKNLSKITSVLQCLVFASVGISVIALIISFFNKNLASHLFSIEALLSVVLNVLFIPYLVSLNKSIYLEHKDNEGKLKVYNFFVSYLIFMRLFDLFQAIVYLLQKNKNRE